MKVNLEFDTENKRDKSLLELLKTHKQVINFLQDIKEIESVEEIPKLFKDYEINTENYFLID